eukprot:4005432-Prymnesium_polylepis.1
MSRVELGASSGGDAVWPRHGVADVAARRAARGSSRANRAPRVSRAAVSAPCARAARLVTDPASAPVDPQIQDPSAPKGTAAIAVNGTTGGTSHSDNPLAFTSFWGPRGCAGLVLPQ